MFKIEDNYLSLEDHLVLKTIMESDNFPWYFNKGKLIPIKNKPFDYQFVHVFYIDNIVNSDYFNRLNPIIKKLEPLSLIRIKANLNPISNKLIEFGKHKDQDFKCKGAIYYLNDNNGYTMIGKNKIESKANRMLLFDANEEHYGTNSTNCNNRMLINFNYF
jgi:hypothetical protein|tara:strand:- start:27 stop:509 length:483 start_codon:yes stop_codon:yes gene_type:complete